MDSRATPAHPAARWARVGGLTVLGAAGAAAGAIVLLPFAARMFVRGLVLVASGCVWLATSLSTGVSGWALVATIWQALGAALATPAASALLWSLVVLGGLALYWLQRLLDSKGE
jgi:hypothetical protein